MIKRYIVFLALVSCLFVMMGCGGEDNSAPADATITIAPTEITVTDGSLWDVHRQPWLITVKDPNGIPLRGVELRISFIWASPDGRYDSLLFDVDNCDGINETPLAQLNDGNTPVDSPMTVSTDEDGSYILNFDFLSGGLDADCDGLLDLDLAGDPLILEWNADIEVTSGSVFNSATFEVKAPE